ncbi:hypothetical protein [Isoptericola sp. AK164]|uniref:hypothetical protein n=1 Tax=Isoptericola sp. AK164 TaxID=3024246 RepID=UPI0024185E59|nr:hypothetical protein [Isoptericola sp. AK164]
MDAPTGPGPATRGTPSVAWVWRSLAAVSVAVSAVVHLVLWSDGYRDLDVVGPLFLLNAVGGFALAVLLVVWRHWLPLVGGIAFGALTLLAFVASGTVGFFDVSGPLMFGRNETIAAVAEVLAVVASTVALLREPSR